MKGIPIATYRLQLTAKFGFDDAAKVVPYLRALGISHLYVSPILKAHASSTHGYDVVDPTRINPELGGEKGFARLVDALRAADVGLIVDFVPNHMSVHHADNPWWLDLLEWGQSSPYARAFDIDWAALPGRPRVLLPILGRPYGETLENGEIDLRYDPREGSFSAWYFEHRLPIAPPTYGIILRAVVAEAGASESAAGRALLDLAHRYEGPGQPDREAAPSFKAALAAIEGGAEVIATGLARFRAGPRGARALHYLIEHQVYRPAHWRLATTQIRYRRFFDINTLAGLRVENEHTFRELHALIARLIAQGVIDGLRLDHIDGLADPAGYCHRLQAIVARRPDETTPFYVVVEKILAEGEQLPPFEGVAGTTGYEWLNVISRVLLDDRGLPLLDRLQRDISGDRRSFEAILAESKLDVISNLLASEFNTLVRLLSRIAAGCYRTRDFDETRLHAALRRYVIHFPVYRTYVTSTGASETDRAMIGRTLERARRDSLKSDRPIFDFLRDALTLDLVAPGRAGHSRRRVLEFVRKLQQFTGPVMAKSLEDTACYRFKRLLALNEVGGNPAAHGLPVPAFHRLMQERVEGLSHGMTATATHDTKRGEDARARLLALSELADDWSAAVAEWQGANARHVRNFDGRRSPSAAHEYMLYQALLGAWPANGRGEDFVARCQAYAVKAGREGKIETSWLDPDETYERGLTGFIDDILKSEAFVRSMHGLAQRTALLGALNSLTQIALKIAMPGVPDFYQGTEFWDLSFVDPDNRRPVDFAARQLALASLPQGTDLGELARTWRDGRIKLAVLHRLLAWRSSMPDVFARGRYQPLAIEGPHRDHVIAFARLHQDSAAILVAGRHFAPLTEGGRQWPRAETWQGHVVLAQYCLLDRPDRQTDVLPLSDAFASVPVAALRARAR
jgi:(1->4)-alpha-D-glucan 1-alpha-D-glucosylmutase